MSASSSSTLLAMAAWLLPLLVILSLALRFAYAWLSTSGVDRLCAFLHYRTTRLKLSLRPRRLILIRHGESHGNVDRACYTTTPDNLIPLTARGREQAREAGRQLKALMGDESVLFYVSPFLRSQQTFSIIAESFARSQYRVREDPRIREQEWGNTQQPSTMEAVLRERERVGRFFYRFQDGESGADVFDRVSSFMESLFREMGQDVPVANIVLVSHGLFMRLFLTRFYRWSVERFTQLRNPPNCRFYLLERDDKFAGFALKSDIRTYKGGSKEAEDRANRLQQQQHQQHELHAEDGERGEVDEEKGPSKLTIGRAVEEVEEDAPETAAARRSWQPSSRASRTQPGVAELEEEDDDEDGEDEDAPSSIATPSPQPVLRPVTSCPVPHVADPKAAVHPPYTSRRLHSMSTEPDAFSPRLTSQSLLASSFTSSPPPHDSFSLHTPAQQSRPHRSSSRSKRETAEEPASERDTSFEAERDVEGFEAEQHEEARKEAALRQRRPSEK